MTPRPDYLYDPYERVDITTPYPNPWDRFRTACGSAMWCRIDDMGQIRHRDGGVCSCQRIVTYINPPWLPPDLEKLMRSVPPAAGMAQGRPRPSSRLATFGTALLALLGLR